jgi:hypothetical protein
MKWTGRVLFLIDIGPALPGGQSSTRGFFPFLACVPNLLGGGGVAPRSRAGKKSAAQDISIKKIQKKFFVGRKLVAELMKNKAPAERLTYTGMDEIRKIKAGMNTARKLED